jgi:hypothetical protein
MADANLAQATLYRAAIKLAQRQARTEVKRALQREGRRKVWQVPMREIVAMAKEYLGAHPELIAEAKATVEEWHRQGVFGPRGGIRNPSRSASRNSNDISERIRA